MTTTTAGAPRVLIGFVIAASIVWAAGLAIGRTTHLVFVVQGIVAFVVLIGCAALHGRALLDGLRPRLAPILTGVGGGVACAVPTVLLWPYVAKWMPFLAVEVRAIYGDVPFQPIDAPLVLLVVMAEEALWRSMLPDALAARRTRTIAYVLSTCAYAAAQAGALTWVTPVLAMAFGLLWSAERVATRSLWAPLITHAIWTFTVVSMPLEG